MAGELEGLPALRTRPRGARYGFHSGTSFEQEEAHWVQLDLGRSYAIDGIVAMPVHIPTIEMQGEGYGFPLRFKIEVADDPEMEGAVRVVDRTAEDVENPGRYPLVFRPDVVTGRYVRFTSTKHVASEEGFIWAMEELMVLSGNRNVAKGASYGASSQLELYPNWAVARINDLPSALGFPVTSEPSPTDGYLSAPSSDERTEKWLVVDLGREFEIEEVRLLAVESDDYEVVGGRGYPRELMVELSADPGFEEVRWRRRRAVNHLGYPWGNPLVMPGGNSVGRYLRVTALTLWARANLHSFALAEVQVYAGGENVALGKPVRVKDAADKPGSTRWAPEFVVLLGWGWMLVRQRTNRRRAVARLREQISRDLHAVIGSNLGASVLMSEMGSRHSGTDDETRSECDGIKKIADETSESIWPMGTRITRLR